MRFLVSLCVCFFATGAAAQEVSECNLTSNYSLATHSQVMSTRTYANGSVSLFVVHDGRPRSADSLFLLVMSPEADDPDAKACQKIGMTQDRGFTNIELRGAAPEFTAAEGLTVDVPTRSYSMEDGAITVAMLSVNVNHRTQEVTVTKE